MDIEQRDYEIGVRGVDLLVKEISRLYIAENEEGSRESQYEESL